MTTRIQRRLTTLEAQAVRHIEKKIKVIEQDGDPTTILNSNDMKLFRGLGKTDYIAHLQELRASFIYEDFPSEE